MVNDYPISASQVKKWKKCPKQFWYSYISDVEVSDDGNKYTEMGNAVHEAIENYLNAGNEMDNTSEIEKNLQIHLSAVEDDYEYGADMEERAQKCLTNAAKYLKLLDEEILGVELDRTFHVDRPGITSDFRAIMDLATENKIVDWKTGNKGPEKVQAAIYIVAYWHEFGELPEEVHFVYMKDGDVNIHKAEEGGEVYWDEEVNTYWDEMVPYAQAMQNAIEMGNFPADPGESKCHWCAYSRHCPEGGGVGDIPWEALR